MGGEAGDAYTRELDAANEDDATTRASVRGLAPDRVVGGWGDGGLSGTIAATLLPPLAYTSHMTTL